MEQLSEKTRLELEKNYVKSTYDNIAGEFSGTRYKKWPKVDSFIQNLPKASLLLDVGCGNGKYLDNPSTINIGCDASANLLKICKKRGFEVILCDMMRLPFKEDIFDGIICIAALHHIVSTKRRQDCVEKMVKLMFSSSSKLLIQVWSYEQELDKDNPYLRGNQSKMNDGRYIADRKEMSIEESLKLPIHKNRTPFANQDLLVPFNLKQTPQVPVEMDKSETSNQYLRYYHVFKSGELEHLIEQTKNAKIIDSYYDRGNWCSIVGRL